MIRVRIVMERRMVREGLVYVLQSDPEIDVVETVASPEETDGPGPIDVILIDMDDAGTASPVFGQILQKVASEANVVAVASSIDPEIERRLQTVGALSCSLKTSPSAELLTMVRAAAEGKSLPLPTNGTNGAEVLEGDGNPDSEQERMLLSQLTRREREILQSIAHGRSTAEVAQDLGISSLTVQSHVKSILAKLGVHSKIQAVGLALRHGLVVPSIRRRGGGSSEDTGRREMRSGS